MAIGNTQLNAFEYDRMDISGNIKSTMRTSWNTFQYVAKNLRAWADETTIGSDIVQLLVDLSNELDNALINTEKFIASLDGYVQRQREANGETIWWK